MSNDNHSVSSSLSFNNNNIPNSLFCPICNIRVPSLEYLNSHLDQEHSESMTDGILNWFKKTQTRVMSPFNKMASGVILSSADKLNKITGGAAGGGGNFVFPFEKNSNKFILNELYNIQNAEDVDVEEFISKMHWVRERGDDICFVKDCHRVLGMRNGKHHCRKCGKLICDVHGNFQMRLSPKTAQHDPLRGLWYRVCEPCYVSRDGYQDNQGVSRNRTLPFHKLRKLKIDHSVKEASKLQKRVEKLVFTLQDTFQLAVHNTSSASQFQLDAQTIRNIENNIVHWEQDDLFTHCPLCGTKFNKLFTRKHHCRLCGAVMCGSINCCQEMKIHTRDNSQLITDIKACTYCHSIVKRYHDFNSPCPSKILQDFHEKIGNLKLDVDENFEKFNHQLMVIQKKEYIELHDHDYQVGLKYRKVLLDSFSKLDKIAKELKTVGRQYPSLYKFTENMSRALVEYLQTYMFSLRLLPKPTSNNNENTNKEKDKKSGKQNSQNQASSSMNMSDDIETVRLKNLTIDNMKEYSELKDKERVLEQQEQVLDQMIDDAVRKRLFEDVSSLKTNFNEIQVELTFVRAQLKALHE